MIPLQRIVTLGTIDHMALTVYNHKCQHYSDSVHTNLDRSEVEDFTSCGPG